MKKQREEGAEKNFRKMRWPCMSCYLSSDPSRHDNFMKPFEDFGVRWASDFVTKLLPQGAWARCLSCQDERRGALGKERGGETNNASQAKRRRWGNVGSEYGGKDSGELGKDHGKLDKDHGKLGKDSGELGGNTNNAYNMESNLASSQACETCTRCSRLLTKKSFWPEDWRHRTKPNIKIMCMECCPTPRKERAGGFTAKNEQASIEAAGKPITCQVCERSLPRSQFRKNAGRKFDFRKPMTCEECRAEGKLPTKGWKKRSLASAQACETCTQCGRTLTLEFFWPEDWRHRMTENMSIKCKEC